MAKSSSRAKPARTPSDILEAARKTLNDDGTVKLTALGPPASRSELVAQLVREGFEAGKGVVRRPLRAQIDGALENGAYIPLKSIAAHVVGASAKEAQEAAKALVASGGAKLVQRGTEDVLVPSKAAVVAREALLQFAEFGKRAAKLAGPNSKVSLLQDDFIEDLRRLLPSGVTLTTARPPRAGDEPQQTHLKELLSAVDANKDPQTGLSFVPKVVAALHGQLAPEVTRERLLEAAKRGLLELRPEGGIGRLSEEELSVCPPGPQGTRLSWARRIEEATR